MAYEDTKIGSLASKTRKTAKAIVALEDAIELFVEAGEDTTAEELHNIAEKYGVRRRDANDETI